MGLVSIRKGVRKPGSAHHAYLDRFEDIDAAIAGTILSQIGNTPLVRLNRIPKAKGIDDAVTIYAKLEGTNPGGSVKDRPALQMVRDGIVSGAFVPGKTLLDSTSGNTGIAYAMIGAVLGFPVTLCMPANASEERSAILDSYGAKIVYTDPLEGSDGAILKSREILHNEPDKYWKPDQYNNPSNPKAHALTTGREIVAQAGDALSHVVATIGTGGTVMGLKQYLGAEKPGVKAIAVEPDHAFHGIEGLKHMASSMVPGIYDESKLDGKIGIETECAYKMTRELALKEGLLVGQSSGAAMCAALEVAKGLKSGTVVAIFPDGGGRYLSTVVWRENGQ